MRHQPKQQRKFFQFLLVALSICMIAVSIRTAFTLAIFPIYTDEIAVRVMLSRIGYDFPIKTGLLAMCGQDHMWPVIWYFPALVEWLLLGQIHHLESLRIIGIITGGIFCLLLTIMAFRNDTHVPSVTKRTGLFMVAFACVLSLMGIGVVPFYLVTVRPEQWILVTLVTLLILSSIKANTPAQKSLSIIFFFICCSLLLYVHPKAIFLTPVLCLIACRIFSDLKNQTAILLWFLLVGMIFINIIVSLDSVTNCHTSPSVQKILLSFNLNFNTILQNPSAFFQEIWDSSLHYMTAINRIQFQVSPEVQYIPSLQLDDRLNSVNTLIVLNWVIIFFSLAACSLFFMIRAFSRKVVTTELLSAIMFLILVASLMINKTKHWYDAGYFWSLLVIALVTCLSGKISRLFNLNITRIFICYLLLVGIVSQIYFIERYEPPLKAGYQGPGVPLYKLDSESLDNTLTKLSAACHIDKDHSQHLILDDLSYLYFQRSRYPLTFTYLFLGYDRNFLHGFTGKLQIDGMIVRAFNLPDVLKKKYAIEADGVICVPQKNIIPLFDEMIPNLELGVYENDKEASQRFHRIPRKPSDY